MHLTYFGVRAIFITGLYQSPILRQFLCQNSTVTTLYPSNATPRLYPMWHHLLQYCCRFPKNLWDNLHLLTNVAFYLFSKAGSAHGDIVNLIENGLNLSYSHLSKVAAMHFKLSHCYRSLLIMHLILFIFSILNNLLISLLVPTIDFSICFCNCFIFSLPLTRAMADKRVYQA